MSFTSTAKKVAEHKGAYSTARYDITAYVHPGRNTLLVKVDSNERSDIPPTGSTVDYLLYGGIYRDVTLYRQEAAFIANALIRYELSGGGAVLRPQLYLDNAGEAFEAQIDVEISREGRPVHRYERRARVEEGESSVTLEGEALSEVELWDLDHPALYDVCIRLLRDGREMDAQDCRIGLRTVGVRPDGFFLNGRKIKIIGLNRHQSFPYVGYAMGKRPQQRDADILKNELHLNMVRCSHYMQSRYFLDRCDELGLMVFEEIPGQLHRRDDYKEVAFNDLQNMVLGHFNHPAIVIWGTRLNESPDDDEFYRETARRCKKMDQSRPDHGRAMA